MDSRGTVRFLAFVGFLLHAGMAQLEPDINSLFFRLFTSNGSHVDAKLTEASSLVPLMDPAAPTKQLIHGYLENVEFDVITTTAAAYMKLGGYNVIGLDYKQFGSRDYAESTLYAPVVGKANAKALESMVNVGLSPNIHLVGLSLGAQISGHTGRNTNFKIPTIIGLDPAGPLHEENVNHLCSGDADFVNVIHTDMGVLGTTEVCGDADFFPNCGHAPQAHCLSSLELETPYCSHVASWRYHAESINRQDAFPAVKCENSIEFAQGTCNTSAIAYMGHATSTTARGKFYLSTATQSPYGLGEEGLKSQKGSVCSLGI